ncbi:MAG: hypothetical protein Q9165_000595 [Trypethelium subeluteriae]
MAARTLQTLPTEILLEILILVQQDDPLTLLDIGCVAHDLRPLALGCLFRHLAIGPGTDVQIRIDALEKYDLWRCVRSVGVSDIMSGAVNASQESVTDPNLPAVVHLIEKCTSVCHLSWHGGGLPPELWKAFTSNIARPQLHISLVTDVADSVWTLSGSPQLSTFILAAPVAYLSDHEPRNTSQVVKRVLSSSPNIKEVGFGLVATPAPEDPPPDYLSSFDFQPSDKIPPLVIFAIRAYPYSRSRLWPPAEINRLVHYWDWSQLQTLSTDIADLATSLASHCPQLQKLHLSRFTPRQLVTTVLDCKSLVRLEWTLLPRSKWHMRISEALALHGKSLKHLSIFRSRRESMEPGALDLNENRLRKLCSAVPNLEVLMLDMYRDGSWPKDELRIIGSLANLVNLNVVFNLSTNDKELAHPVLNTHSARKLLQYVISGITSKESRFTFLQIETGAPDIPAFSSMPLMRKKGDTFRGHRDMYLQWLRSQSEMICLKASGRPEMMWRAHFDVHCPSLAEMERKLRRRQIPMEQWHENDDYRRLKGRADIGPITQEEWESENEEETSTGEEDSS